MLPPPPGSTLFPYTTLFRSGDAARYLSPLPQNIKLRQTIRSEGLKLLRTLHDSRDYDRIIVVDRKSTRLNSSHVATSYAVFCLKKKTATTLRMAVLALPETL